MPSDGLQYEVDHLLNLEVTPSSLTQQGTEGDRNSTSSSSSLSPQVVISRPEEAIIRLHELDRTKCFRPVRVILKLDPTEMKIIDKNTKNVAERIPYYSITPCHETFVRSVMDRCGNLVVMKIEDYLQIAPAQFYIFQFDTKKPVAKEFLQNFDAAKTKDSKNGPPPAAVAATAKPPLTGTPSSTSSRTSINMAEWYDEEGAKGTAMATIKYKQKSSQPPPARTVFQQQNENQQQMDVYLELLNRCLDEVELLVTKLQDVADAYKQLEERKKNNRKSGFGDGMLVMRARPPNREEFITVFQYIKLSFNLLAKLKGHINNPNSPEIVHYLFQPLDLIVEASCQIVAPNEKPIWEEVITPLLNDETITFLEDCMFTKEVEIWKCLGTAWNIGAGQKSFWLLCCSNVPMYVPVFSDGWSPDPKIMPPLSASFGQPMSTNWSRPPSLTTTQPPKPNQPPYNQQLQSPQQPYPPQQPPYYPPQQPQFQPQQPQYPPQPANKRQSQMAMQQIRQEIQQVEQQNQQQQQQYFPSARPQLPSPTVHNDNMIYQQVPLSQQQLHDQQPQQQQQQVDYLISQGKDFIIATYNRPAENNQELDVERGDVFEVLEVGRMRSKVRSCNTGLIGYLPMSVIRSFEMNPDDNSMESSKTDQEKVISRNQIKAEIQQQLPEVPRKPKFAANGTPIATINISEKSSPEDVKHWLACKGFSQEVQSSLSGFGGKEIFVMEKNLLVQLFGPDVGVKLFSQILVQKNISGYKTLRVCELNAILEVRKKKADRLMVGEMFNSQPDNSNPDVDHF